MQKKILIIEDRTDSRNLISRALTKSGYLVVGAEDGEKGLKILKKDGFDLLILDLMLPGMSGLEVLENVRKDKRHAKTKVLVLTAAKLEETMKKAFLKMGAQVYLEKPIQIEELRKQVKELIG